MEVSKTDGENCELTIEDQADKDLVSELLRRFIAASTDTDLAAKTADDLVAVQNGAVRVVFGMAQVHEVMNLRQSYHEDLVAAANLPPNQAGEAIAHRVGIHKAAETLLAKYAALD